MVIPVVFAVNDAYSPMLGVVVHSLKKYANDSDKYVLYVLNGGIGNGHKKKLLSLKEENISIELIDVTEAFSTHKIDTIGHLSKETAYRFLIPELFSQYDKVLYLDSDILIRKDVAELYKENIEDYAVGAVRGRLFNWSHEYITEKLNISEKDYFNAGILLINVPLFRKLRFGETGLKMLEEGHYLTQDQDVLNILCQKHEGKLPVKFLDGRWNFEWEHLTEHGEKVYLDEIREGSLELINDPWIIHYTSPKKPWVYPELELAELFWDEAKETVFYEELLVSSSSRRFFKEWIEPARLFDTYLFPWNMFKPGEKIIIYGAGLVGRTLYQQLKETGYNQVIAICDKKAKDINDIPVTLIYPEELASYPEYKILIAIEKESVADSIRNELAGQGISSDRIVWTKYRRKE